MVLLGHEIYFLYHATYGAYVENIKKMGGLVPDVHQNWDISKKGVVYLCDNSTVAASFCETCDEVPEDYLDDIIVYELDASKLDSSKIKLDENWPNDNECGEGYCFTYEGIIPFDLLTETDYV